MEGTVVKLCDLDSLMIPAELLQARAEEREIDEGVQRLSLRFAADELNAVAFGRINITRYPDIAEKFGINAMPTLLFFRRGELVDQAVGSMDREQLFACLATLLYQ